MRLFKQSMLFLLVLSMLFLVLSSCSSKTKTIEILYYDSNSETAINTVIHNVDEPLKLPNNPSKEFLTFGGWYLDDKTFKIPFTIDYDLNLIEGETLTVFAKWNLKISTISFDTHGGSSVNPITYSAFDSSMKKPNNPVKEYYIFVGWYRDNNLTIPYAFDIPIIEDTTLHAKWEPLFYTITLNTNGGSSINPISHSILQSSIHRPDDPVKEGHTFVGWYRDNDLTIPYAFDIPILEDTTLYAKWELNEDENKHLATDVLRIYSNLYGNTNGNLNNQGLAVYDYNRMLHYVSYQSSVYSYDPSSDETTLLFTLPSGGRAIFLNMDRDILYFINNNEGHLLSYHLIDKNFTTISETENIYASRTQSWVNFMYKTVSSGTEYVAYQRYITTTQSLSSIQGYGFEHVAIDGTRAYYKPIDSLSLRVMSYNGLGKSTIVDLVPLGVTNQFESLLYRVNNDYVSYFALVLEIGGSSSLYLYNSNDGLVKVMSGQVHSLNYDGTYLYAISGSGLYKIDPATHAFEMIYTLPSSDNYLNIINNWFYIGSSNSLGIYRINPVTKEIEVLFD